MASRSIKNRPSAKKKHPKIGLLVVVTVLAAVVVAGGVGIYALGSSWLQDLPDYEDADAFNTSLPSEMYADDNATLLAKFQLENREPVELNQISSYVIKGTIATEDERFYDHGGFDLWGIMRAAFVTLTGSGREGASTITQQFVRNTILSSEMNDISIKRKVREMYLSVKLEEKYSKDEILRMYLNTINYGSGAYGIQAASQRYFSKDATDLTLAEAALLIGIPQSPTYNNPVDNKENSLARRNLVLDRMLSNGYITQEEHDAAQNEDIVLVQNIPTNDGILKYPYFTSYAREQLKNEFGLSDAEILQGGLRIRTTINPMAQQAAEAAAANKESQVDDVFEVALAAVEPGTGYIKALVGGKDYYTYQVNMATGTGGLGRMPGSSFKTFTLVSSIEKGISPQTMIDCSATAQFPGWSVENINKTNYGTRSIARAFAVSSNTGFARLFLSLEPETVIDTAKRMGITSDLQPQATLALGSEAVTPLEMAEAYATLADGGMHYEATPIIEVYDRNGNLKVDNTNPEGTQEVSPEVAHAAVEVMRGVIQTSEGTGHDAALPSGQVVAGKTGTSEEYKDSWFCGITPQMSVALWLGDRRDYNGDDPCRSLPTSVTVASAFRDFMSEVLSGQPLEDFPTAADPAYQTYTDAKYNIGGYGYSSGSGSSSSSNSGNSGSTNDGTSSGNSAGTGNGSSSGGTTGGTDTPGGGSTGGGTGGTDPGTGGGTGTDPGTGGGTGTDPGTGGGSTDPGTGGGTGGETGGGGTGGGTGGDPGTTPAPASMALGIKAPTIWSCALQLFAA